MNTSILIRTTALTLGFAAAGVGCFASYEAAARADGGYLMVAAPVVALAAAIVPAYVEVAWRARQYVKAIALLAVFLPCAATVFYTAVERVHAAKAGGEAQRTSLRQAVDRAETELAGAKAAKTAATAAANRLRGLEGKACKVACLSAKASETAAASRVAVAETALAAAQAKAVTEADIKQPDWLLPLALDITGMALIWAGFTLGRAPVPVPAILTLGQIAARKGVETKKRNRRLRAKARRNGPKLAVSR